MFKVEQSKEFMSRNRKFFKRLMTLAVFLNQA